MIFKYISGTDTGRNMVVMSALLGCSAVWVDLSAILRQSTGHFLILMEPICCPKMSVTNQFTPCNNQEKKRFQLLHGKNLKYCVVLLVYRQNNQMEHTY